MKYLSLAGVALLAACSQAPEPIYDASVYHGGKVSVAPVTSHHPKANPLLVLTIETDRCWNQWGQHNNYPGCPWFAEGGGDIKVGANDGSGADSNQAGEGDAYVPSRPSDSNPSVDAPVSNLPDNESPDSTDDPVTDPGSDHPVEPGPDEVCCEDDFNNPGNDKPVGQAGEKPNDNKDFGTGDKGTSG